MAEDFSIKLEDKNDPSVEWVIYGELDEESGGWGWELLRYDERFADEERVGFWSDSKPADVDFGPFETAVAAEEAGRRFYEWVIAHSDEWGKMATV